jgi:hypothetical protein
LPFHSASKTQSQDFTDPSGAHFMDELKHTWDAAKSPRLPTAKVLNPQEKQLL